MVQGNNLPALVCFQHHRPQEIPDIEAPVLTAGERWEILLIRSSRNGEEIFLSPNFKTRVIVDRESADECSASNWTCACH
jgi:hypothetical protein